MAVDLFSLIEEVSKELLIKKHTFIEEDVSLRYAYGIGLSIISHQKGHISTDGGKALEEMCLGLDLSQEQIEEIFKVGIAPDKEMLKTVINTLDKIQYQIMFLLDAQLLLKKEDIEIEILDRLIVSFMQLFKMSGESQKLYRNISDIILGLDDKERKEELKEFFEVEVSDIILEYMDFHLTIGILKNLLKTDKNVYHSLVYYVTDKVDIGVKNWSLLMDEMKKSIITESKEVHKLNEYLDKLEKEKQKYSPPIGNIGTIASTVSIWGKIAEGMISEEDSRPRWKELNYIITNNKELKLQKEEQLGKLKKNLELFQKEVTLIQTALDNLYIRS